VLLRESRIRNPCMAESEGIEQLEPGESGASSKVLDQARVVSSRYEKGSELSADYTPCDIK
jgi:hypothetical protein